MNALTHHSLRTHGRIAGLLYLAIIIGGIYAEFFVRMSLKVPGDAATTAAQIMAADGLFRSGIAADLLMIVCDVAIGVIFYVVLRPVNNTLALLAAFFRLAQAATLGMNLLNLLVAGRLLSGAAYLDVLGTDQLYAQAMLALEAHSMGYALAMVFFALSILLLGYLIIKSDTIPMIFGVFMIVAALGYLIDSLGGFFWPGYATYQEIFTMIVLIPALVAEVSFALWLLIRGSKTPQPQLQSSYAAA